MLGVCLTLVRRFLARGDTIVSGEWSVGVCVGGVLNRGVLLAGEGLINRVWVVRGILSDGVYGLVCTRIAFGSIRTRKTKVVKQSCLWGISKVG